MANMDFAVRSRRDEGGVVFDLRDLFSEMIPGWLYPHTDLITSFAPFNNLPTQYKLTLDGQQKWFGQ